MAIAHYDPIIKELIEMFGLPDGLVEFTIKVKLDSLVEVECVFRPDISEDAKITRRYHLVSIDDKTVKTIKRINGSIQNG